MIDPEIIATLKSTYGEIYVVNEGRKDYVFRPLNVGEFEYLTQGILDSSDSEDYAVQVAVVWPEDLDVSAMRAGVISSIAQEILEVSAFTNPKRARQVFESKRDDAQDVIKVMKAVILACYGELGYTEADIKELTFSQLCERVALAEQIIRIRKTINDPGLEISLDIVDPDEVSEEDKRQQEAELAKLKSGDPDARTTLGTARGDDPIAAKLHSALRGL